MKRNDKRYIYTCDNCGHEFSMKTAIRNRMVECSRCGEKTAYCEDNMDDDYIDLLDKRGSFDSDDMDYSSDYMEYDDQHDYYE